MSCRKYFKEIAGKVLTFKRTYDKFIRKDGQRSFFNAQNYGTLSGKRNNLLLLKVEVETYAY